MKHRLLGLEVVEVDRLRTRLGKRTAAVGLALLLVAGGGLAWALWSANGSGSGQANAITAQSITVSAAAGAADLYPGGPAGAVSFTLTNPNPYAVTFTAMTPGAVTSSDPVNCPAANVAVVPAAGLSLNVAGGATSGTLSVPGVVSMIAAAPDGCQGVTFTVPVTLTGSQV